MNRYAAVWGYQFRRYPKFFQQCHLLRGDDEDYIAPPSGRCSVFTIEKNWSMEGLNYCLILYRRTTSFCLLRIIDFYRKGIQRSISSSGGRTGVSSCISKTINFKVILLASPKMYMISIPALSHLTPEQLIPAFNQAFLTITCAGKPHASVFRQENQENLRLEFSTGDIRQWAPGRAHVAWHW